MFSKALNSRLGEMGVTGAASVADPGLAATGLNIQHDLVRMLGLSRRGISVPSLPHAQQPITCFSAYHTQSHTTPHHTPHATCHVPHAAPHTSGFIPTATLHYQHTTQTHNAHHTRCASHTLHHTSTPHHHSTTPPLHTPHSAHRTLTTKLRIALVDASGHERLPREGCCPRG